MNLSDNSGKLNIERSSATSNSRAVFGFSGNFIQTARRKRKMDVKVCLFGPVDHDQTQKFLKEEASKLEEMERKRWNFDFATEQPLPGLWKWEAVAERDAPVFYGSVTCSWDNKLASAADDVRPADKDHASFRSELVSAFARGAADSSQEDKENIKRSRQDIVEQQSWRPRCVPEGLELSPKRKTVARPTVLDFYPIRKRRSPSSKSLNGSCSEENASSLEETSCSSQ